MFPVKIILKKIIKIYQNKKFQVARARNSMMGSYHNTFHRGQVGNNLGRPPIGNIMASTSFRPRGRPPMGMPPRSTPVQGIPILRSGVMVRHNTPSPVMVSPNYPLGGVSIYNIILLFLIFYLYVKYSYNIICKRFVVS